MVTDAPAKPERVARQPTSAWAISAMVFSLLGVLPLCIPSALIGPLLGWRALADLRRRKDKSGAALAKTAIVIGLLVAAAYTWGITWWAVNVRALYLHGPREALVRGVNNNEVRSFKSHFTDEGAFATDDEAAAFLRELAHRYGALVDVFQHPAPRRMSTAEEFYRPVVTYALVFERANLECETHIIIRDEFSGKFVLLLRCLTIYDPQRGDLHFPAASPLPPLKPVVIPPDSDLATPATVDSMN